MENEIIIEEHPDLETASKDHLMDGSQYTEWEHAMAMHSFPIGSVITPEQWDDALHVAQTQASIDYLCEKGIIESYWDEEQGAVVYKYKEQ